MDDQVRAAPSRRVVVTGATGFVGRRLLPRLAATHEVIAVQHRREPPAELARLPISWRPGGLDQLVLCGVDLVVHLASQEQGPARQVFATNVDGTRRLVQACRRDGVDSLIAVSSLDAVLTAGGDYAESKREAESIVRASGIDWMILRPSVLYGPAAGALICRLVRLAARGLPVPLLGDGSQRVQPLHVDDLVELVCAAAGGDAGRRAFEVAGPEPASYREIVAEAARICGKKLRLAPLPVALVAAAGVAMQTLMPRAPLSWGKVQSALQDKIAVLAALRRDFPDWRPRTLARGLAQMMAAEGFAAE